MDNLKSVMEKLRAELLRLRNKIELSNDQLPIELGLPEILIEIEHELNNPAPSKKKLEEGSYGIFRLVTESYEFEKSDLGQELLSLRGKIKEFTSTLDSSE